MIQARRRKEAEKGSPMVKSKHDGTLKIPSLSLDIYGDQVKPDMTEQDRRSKKKKEFKEKRRAKRLKSRNENVPDSDAKVLLPGFIPSCNFSAAPPEPAASPPQRREDLQVQTTRLPNPPQQVLSLPITPPAVSIASSNCVGLHTTSPTAPLQLQQLTVKTMIPPSPQLEALASPSSPPPIRIALGMLSLLQSRASQLQSQIPSFETLQKRTQAKLRATLFHSEDVDRAKMRADLEIYDELIILTSEHWNEVFIMEHALRDVIDEGFGEEGWTLEACLEETMSEFEHMVEVYDEILWEKMRKLCPEAVDKIMTEIEEDTGAAGVDGV